MCDNSFPLQNSRPFLYENVFEIFLAVVVGNFFAWQNLAARLEKDFVVVVYCLGIWEARIVGITGRVPTRTTVDVPVLRNVKNIQVVWSLL